MLCTQYQDQHCFNRSFTIKIHQQQNKSEFSGAKIAVSSIKVFKLSFSVSYRFTKQQLCSPIVV